MGRAAQRGRSTCLGAGEGALQQSRTRAGMLSGAGFGRAGRGAPFRVEGFGLVLPTPNDRGGGDGEEVEMMMEVVVVVKRWR